MKKRIKEISIIISRKYWKVDSPCLLLLFLRQKIKYFFPLNGCGWKCTLFIKERNWETQDSNQYSNIKIYVFCFSQKLQQLFTHVTFFSWLLLSILFIIFILFSNIASLTENHYNRLMILSTTYSLFYLLLIL